MGFNSGFKGLTFTELESRRCYKIIALFVIYISYTSRSIVVRIIKFKLTTLDMRWLK